MVCPQPARFHHAIRWRHALGRGGVLRNGPDLAVSAGAATRPAPARRLAGAAAVIALAVELSQLAHPAWLDTFRSLPGVGLVLGYDFVASDLVCYAAGIALGLMVEYASPLEP
jgi:hypothetical protein